MQQMKKHSGNLKGQTNKEEIDNLQKKIFQYNDRKGRSSLGYDKAKDKMENRRYS